MRNGREVLTAEQVAYSFFWRRSEHSFAKAMIAYEAFVSWARLMLRRDGVTRVAFIDPYAGPGRYASGQPSTPLLVLRKVASDTTLRRGVVLRFSDRERVFAEALEVHAATVAPKTEVAYTVAVDDAASALAAAHSELPAGTPVFVFADPWRYSGIGESLLSSALWSRPECGVLSLFNYWRAEQALRSGDDQTELAEIFGYGRLAALRTQLVSVGGPAEREALVLDALTEAFCAAGERAVEVFRFRNLQGGVSHHLVFVTAAGNAGSRIVRDVMTRYSLPPKTRPVFEYNGRLRSANADPAVADELLQLLAELRSGRSDGVVVYDGETLVTSPTSYAGALGSVCELEEVQQWISGTHATYRFRGHFSNAGFRDMTLILDGAKPTRLFVHEERN